MKADEDLGMSREDIEKKITELQSQVKDLQNKLHTTIGSWDVRVVDDYLLLYDVEDPLKTKWVDNSKDSTPFNLRIRIDQFKAISKWLENL
jgi:hypothetical protein